MARVNVYLPDQLADAARAAGLNVSGVTQEALKAALVERDANNWLDSVLQRTTPSGDQTSEPIVVTR